MNKGYTLAELLITFAFLGVVLALWIPTLLNSPDDDTEQQTTDRLDEFNKTVKIKEESLSTTMECTSFVIEIRNEIVKVRREK